MIDPDNNKKISVVIPSVNGLPIIKECLESIYRQNNSDISEVIVVDCSNEQTRKVISETFNDIILIHPQRKKTIPELRAIGIKEAKCDIVAMIEDHCIVSENWFTEILKAHESGYVAIGGAVENACCDRILDWATFFCEYSSFIQPVHYGPVRDLPGNNVSYKRSEIISVLGGSIDEGVWEGFLHQKLIEHGYELLSTPSLVVYHKKAFCFFEFMAQRFYYSQSFAGMRNREVSKKKRIYLLIFSVLLPPAMLLRITKRVYKKKRLRKEFLQAFLLLVAFSLSWGAGEFLGYLIGQGNSLLKIK